MEGGNREIGLVSRDETARVQRGGAWDGADHSGGDVSTDFHGGAGDEPSCGDVGAGLAEFVGV